MYCRGGRTLRPSFRQSSTGYTKVAPVDGIFHACDTDGIGSLTLQESQKALRALGFYPTEEELWAALEALGLEDFPLASPAVLRKVGLGLDSKRKGEAKNVFRDSTVRLKSARSRLHRRRRVATKYWCGKVSSAFPSVFPRFRSKHVGENPLLMRSRGL